MVIEFTGKQQFFFLNSKELSAYYGEQEVLLQDGILYEVIDVSVQTESIERGDGIEFKK